MTVERVQQLELDREIKLLSDGCLLDDAEVFVGIEVVADLASDAGYVSEEKSPVVAGIAVAGLASARTSVWTRVLIIKGGRRLKSAVSRIVDTL